MNGLTLTGDCRRRGHGILHGRTRAAATYGPCRSYGKRTERVSHSSLDGAKNAPPTTAHRDPFFSCETATRTRTTTMTLAMQGG